MGKRMHSCAVCSLSTCLGDRRKSRVCMCRGGRPRGGGVASFKYLLGSTADVPEEPIRGPGLCTICAAEPASSESAQDLARVRSAFKT
jgi:hypothetical protein